MKTILMKLKEASSGIILLLLLAGSFSYAMFQGGFVSWFLFYSFLPFGLYSFALMLYPIKEFSVKRTVKGREWKAGATLSVTIELTRKSRFPLFYLVVEEQVSDTLLEASGASSIKRLVYPGFKRKVTFSYSIHQLPRGEHELRGVRVKTGDFLGIFQKSRFLEEQSVILVYPSFVELTYRPMDVRFDQGTASADVQFQRDTTMATGLREYEPGDRVSWIHWKSFARTNELMTKEFEERKSHDVCVMLDRTPGSSFETMVTFTASLVRAVIKKGAQVGYISSGSTVQHLPVKSGEGHQRQVFYQLAKAKDDSTQSIVDVVKMETGQVRFSAAMMFVTSRLSRELIHALHDFTKNNSSVIVFFVKGASDRISAEEQQAKAFAASKGLLVREIRPGQFADAFSEVKQA